MTAKDKMLMAEKPLLVAPITSFSRFFPGNDLTKLNFPEQNHNTSLDQNLFTLLPNYHQARAATRTQIDNINKQLNEMNVRSNKQYI